MSLIHLFELEKWLIISLSYRNQFIDLQSKSMDWVLYDRNFHHKKLRISCLQLFYRSPVLKEFAKLRKKQWQRPFHWWMSAASNFTSMGLHHQCYHLNFTIFLKVVCLQKTSSYCFSNLTSLSLKISYFKN